MIYWRVGVADGGFLMGGRRVDVGSVEGGKMRIGGGVIV